MSSCATPTRPAPRSERLGTPNTPAIRFARGTSFGASRFTHLLRPAKLLAPLYGSDRYARPPGAFTSRLPTDRLPSPLLDMTTTVTGTPLLAGLSPAGMAASLAALVRPCVARDFDELVASGLASMYPAFDWSAGSGPSWISARVRSHYRTGLNRPNGSPVFACAGKTEPSISSHPLADLGG